LEYRRAPVKHADETGWRNDGCSGYGWLFCTALISLYRFRQSRSADVPKEVFGSKRLRGVLVVDRYKGYNRMPCSIQYCYSHLLREVQDLGKDFPEVGEVAQFVEQFAPLLAEAMKLRGKDLQITDFRQRALELKLEIKTAAYSPAPGHSENPKYIPRASRPPLSLGQESNHSGGQQPRRTGAASLGHRP